MTDILLVVFVGWFGIFYYLGKRRGSRELMAVAWLSPALALMLLIVIAVAP